KTQIHEDHAISLLSSQEGAGAPQVGGLVHPDPRKGRLQGAAHAPSDHVLIFDHQAGARAQLTPPRCRTAGAASAGSTSVTTVPPEPDATSSVPAASAPRRFMLVRPKPRRAPSAMPTPSSST